MVTVYSYITFDWLVFMEHEKDIINDNDRQSLSDAKLNDLASELKEANDSTFYGYISYKEVVELIQSLRAERARVKELEDEIKGWELGSRGFHD